MPKPSTLDADAAVSFKVFWQDISNQLGDAWLVLDPSSDCIKRFVVLSYDPKDYFKNIIIESYKRSQCENLNSPISMDAVLDVLGETAYSLQGDSQDDLFDIELLEEIAWHISNRYAHLINFEISATQDETKNNPVISFPDYRIRKANARL